VGHLGLHALSPSYLASTTARGKRDCPCGAGDGGQAKLKQV
jgi:hypothetical protein